MGFSLLSMGTPVISGSNLGATKNILVSPNSKPLVTRDAELAKVFFAAPASLCRGGAARADYGTFWGSCRAPRRGPKSPPCFRHLIRDDGIPDPHCFGDWGHF